jgi:hypothetical protein
MCDDVGLDLTGPEMVRSEHSTSCRKKHPDLCMPHMWGRLLAG